MSKLDFENIQKNIKILDYNPPRCRIMVVEIFSRCGFKVEGFLLYFFSIFLTKAFFSKAQLG